MTNEHSIFLGTAGWSIPRQHADRAPGTGSHLQRYAQQLPCAEINSSFYRPHRPGTYQRWAEATPDGFRFSVKVPRALTHEGALAPDADTLQRFLDETAGLGEKRGPLLLQLPPKLALDIPRATTFLQLFRGRYDGLAVLEPRHPSWFSEAAEALLTTFRISRVAADPLRVPQAMTPAGDPSIVYYRLHGSPRIYYSDYTEDFLQQLAIDIQRAAQDAIQVWCIFDNTASGAALGNAFSLRDRTDAAG